MQHYFITHFKASFLKNKNTIPNADGKTSNIEVPKMVIELTNEIIL